MNPRITNESENENIVADIALQTLTRSTKELVKGSKNLKKPASTKVKVRGLLQDNLRLKQIPLKGKVVKVRLLERDEVMWIWKV
jgi:hypothetical protein